MCIGHHAARGSFGAFPASVAHPTSLAPKAESGATMRAADFAGAASRIAARNAVGIHPGASKRQSVVNAPLTAT